MQHVLVALQQEKSSSYSIYIFVISLFGCPPALDARGRRPVRPPPLHATDRANGDTKNKAQKSPENSINLLKLICCCRLLHKVFIRGEC